MNEIIFTSYDAVTEKIKSKKRDHQCGQTSTTNCILLILGTTALSAGVSFERTSCDV